MTITAATITAIYFPENSALKTLFNYFDSKHFEYVRLSDMLMHAKSTENGCLQWHIPNRLVIVTFVKLPFVRFIQSEDGEDSDGAQ